MVDGAHRANEGSSSDHHDDGGSSSSPVIINRGYLPGLGTIVEYKSHVPLLNMFDEFKETYKNCMNDGEGGEKGKTPDRSIVIENVGQARKERSVDDGGEFDGAFNDSASAEPCAVGRAAKRRRNELLLSSYGLRSHADVDASSRGDGTGVDNGNVNDNIWCLENTYDPLVICDEKKCTNYSSAQWSKGGEIWNCCQMCQFKNFGFFDITRVASDDTCERVLPGPSTGLDENWTIYKKIGSRNYNFLLSPDGKQFNTHDAARLTIHAAARHVIRPHRHQLHVPRASQHPVQFAGQPPHSGL